MTMPNRATRRHPTEILTPMIPGGDASGSKWLIAAVLAAGKDGCECDSCKLLKKFAGELSASLLKEDSESGTANP